VQCVRFPEPTQEVPANIITSSVKVVQKFILVNSKVSLKRQLPEWTSVFNVQFEHSHSK